MDTTHTGADGTRTAVERSSTTSAITNKLNEICAPHELSFLAIPGYDASAAVPKRECAVTWAVPLISLYYQASAVRTRSERSAKQQLRQQSNPSPELKRIWIYSKCPTCNRYMHIRTDRPALRPVRTHPNHRVSSRPDPAVAHPFVMMFEAFGFSEGAPCVAEHYLSYLRAARFGGYARYF